VATYLESADYSHMTPGLKSYVGGVAGRCLSLFTVPCLVLAAFAGRKLRPDEIYRTYHSLDSLIRHHSEHWSAARFARTINPLRQPDITHAGILQEKKKRVDGIAGTPATGSFLLPGIVTPQALPTWARSVRPEEWLDAQGLDWSDEYCDLDEVSEALAGQLRSCWKGWRSLDIHHKALAAIFILFNVFRTKEAEALIDDLAVIYAERGIHVGMKKAIREEEGLLARIDSIIGSPDAARAIEDGRAMKDVADGHAWIETAMVGMLQESRAGKGILASARFLWLKQCDRTLWYALNNLGGNTYMIECAGIMAHFRAEQQFGFPIATPYVRQAARALVIDYLDLDEKRVAKRREDKEKRRNIADRVRSEVQMATEATMAIEAGRQQAGT
jgi:hypothetical protein